MIFNSPISHWCQCTWLHSILRLSLYQEKMNNFSFFWPALHQKLLKTFGPIIWYVKLNRSLTLICKHKHNSIFHEENQSRPSKSSLKCWTSVDMTRRNQWKIWPKKYVSHKPIIKLHSLLFRRHHFSAISFAPLIIKYGWNHVTQT